MSLRHVFVFAAPMIQPENYTGRPLNDLARRTCAGLEAAGFEVKALPSSNPDKARNLIRIYWREVYVGQLHSDLWTKGFGCLYRFNPMDGIKGFRFAEPPDYSEQEFMRLHDLQAAEFSVRQDGKQGGRYYRISGVDATLKVMRQVARAVDNMLGIAGHETYADEVAEDLADIAASKLPALEKDALVKARLGQGKFRQDLGDEFAWTCPASGLNLPDALRASHIVAWREANNEEKREPLNGLLLAANVDALFDRHLLTFTPDGGVLFSMLVAEGERRKLGPIGGLAFQPCQVRAGFLSRHNKRFNDLEAERAQRVKSAAKES